MLVIVNDILDHVDGIVAKVHKEQYGQIDDPMFGAFIDAFCDKVYSCIESTPVCTIRRELKESPSDSEAAHTVKLLCLSE